MQSILDIPGVTLLTGLGSSASSLNVQSLEEKEGKS